ncbi:DUF2029 domain-containing protein [Bradyrhizobium sp. CSA207]|uniref:glycosyltransferase family 87 protein n=1 Tax=Bradyrhizobium sp. CSA207 TaxID=2698826 RepID=UPI0023B1663C|nr:glycosyltransferase family 87 protein [Bradyrhizobium sp. CSA207]MDE5442381.1 DUF2029 domain-containing protein [Bradyrhizobium sp. CSA207]
MGDVEAWSTARSAQRLALYVAFIACSLFWFRNASGDDLSSSYIGCRLLANGSSDHLYDFHPTLFHVVDTAAWISTAASAHFTGFLHPYVQTPLWAWVLLPLCTNLTFGGFSIVFLVIALLSLAVAVEVVARAWAGSFLRPLPLAVLLIAIAMSTPFRYAMSLVQTHALFLMLAVLALHLAQRDRAVPAGALLALACAVKITPGLLVVYWLAGGRYRAALWFVVCSVILAALTVAAVGTDLTLAYVQSMRRVSNVLLVSYNNQSLAAWLAYSDSMSSELDNWRMLPLTPALKAASLVASIAGVAFSGWMSRRNEWAGASAALALVVITVFSPIAWTHYFLSVIPAVMILTNVGGLLSLAVAIPVFLLNTPLLAIDPTGPQLGPMVVLRSHFFSAMILMAVLILRYVGSKPTLASSGKDPP